jgi:hypothetical protein
VNTVVSMALHPNRVTTRGITLPPSGEVICQLSRDPSSEEIESHGESVEKHRVGYPGADGTAISGSGESFRVTAH